MPTIQIMAHTRSTRRKPEWIPISFNQIVEGTDKLTLGYKVFKILVDGEEVYMYNEIENETVKNATETLNITR